MWIDITTLGSPYIVEWNNRTDRKRWKKRIRDNDDWSYDDWNYGNPPENKKESTVRTHIGFYPMHLMLDHEGGTTREALHFGLASSIALQVMENPPTLYDDVQAMNETLKFPSHLAGPLQAAAKPGDNHFDANGDAIKPRPSGGAWNAETVHEEWASYGVRIRLVKWICSNGRVEYEVDSPDDPDISCDIFESQKDAMKRVLDLANGVEVE